MTYPQYPQGYAPQSAPPAPPQYPPMPPQGYAPAQQPGPQHGQGIAAPPPPMPTLANGGGAGGAWPKMRNLVGRTIIVEPIRVDEEAKDPAGKPRPEAYFHLTVVDGGPLQYGDNQDRDVSKQRPATHEIDTPCRFTNVNSYSYGFVQVVRDCLSSGEAGRVGVVQQGTQGNLPYLITKTDVDVHGNERPGGEARFAAAMEQFGKIWADKHAELGAPRQFANPTARSLVAPPPYPAAAPQINYGQPQQQPAPQPTYVPPQQYANIGAPVVQGYMQPPAAPALPPHIEAWLATLDPATAAQQRAAFRAQAGQPQAQPTGPGI